MYFVPVRKLLKILFVRGVSTKRERLPLSFNETLNKVPDPRRRYSRRWPLLIIMILVCFYIVFYYKSTQNIIVKRQHVSTNNISMLVYSKTGHVVKKTSAKFDDENGLADDILEHNDENIKEENITTIATTTKSIFVYQETDTPRNNENVTLVTTDKNEEDEPMLPSATNDALPVCGTMAEQNDIGEHTKVRRILTDNLFSDVKMGGYYCPKNCRSRHKVAVLVPYRNRERNLAVFMYHMHPFLMKQQLEYRIFVIEQAGGELFNRGKLFNIGFMEMLKYNEWHCVVLHDVDLLPQSDKILYTCPTFPRHMCGTVVEKAKLTYNQYHTLFGGVSALSVQHYKEINGFSNLYWGWGGEDNDMYWRILSSRIPMVRYNKTIAQYTSLPHARQPKNNHRYQLLKFTLARCKTDGLSSLVYKVIWTKHLHLYTHILADVNPLKENITNIFRQLFS